MEEDKYFNKKQQKEFQEAMEYANKQAENGRRGAEVRWGGYSNPNGDANGNPNGETITTNPNTNTNFFILLLFIYFLGCIFEFLIISISNIIDVISNLILYPIFHICI